MGSDCGGWVCIAGSYFGRFGMRPTWGRVTLEGVVPFGPSFDVAGWFARDAALLQKVGHALLDDRQQSPRPKRLLVASDAFALVEGRVIEALRPQVSRLEHLIGRCEEIELRP